MDGIKEEKSESIQGLKREVARRWYEDGMFEIGIGMLFLFIVLGLYLGFRFGLPSRFNLIVKLLWSIGYISLGFAACWLIRKLKEKLVWGKDGYSVIRDVYSEPVLIFMSLGLLFLLISVYSSQFLIEEVRLSLTGLGLCFAFVAQFFQTGKLKRFLLFCILPIFVALINILLDVSWKQNLYLEILIIGFALIVSGTIAYKRFKRKSPE
jgi:hypothetical protein